ncbi:helix-turn-helix transcriptional regulator [Tsukamurella spumae]|uniref:Helix-turn-helix transcriptional regulator n=1 Tax=Tsukamurella spumae TaxID=44753 RepID=A0A846X841_9ACTN|nr:helix-turn-helix transcriptional regulator [Tsukamurella spumae]NKY20449.1 helix-turn-helix transcriptional regulator [Tsukamurella spumae]
MVGAVQVTFVRQELAASVEWSVDSADHEVRVWRRGTAAAKEYEFASGASGRISSHAANVWVIPAGDSSVAVARDVACDFARITLSAHVFRNTSLRASAGKPDRLLHHLVERIASTTARTDLTGRLLHESLVSSARLHILDLYGERPVEARSPGSPLRPEIEDRVLERLHTDDMGITLSSLADIAEMTPDEFGRAFARSFHTTPHQYVMNRRLEKARRLLANTTMPIADIGAATGFSSGSHFATTFKRHVGTTPSRYRSQS